MPPARYIFVLVGILGVLAMFRPLIAIGRGPLRVDLSAYELSFGLARTHNVIDRKLPGIIEKRIPADIRETRDDIKLVTDASRGMGLAFIPAACVLLLGALGVWRKKTGAIEAAAAIVLGLASTAAWLGLRYGVAYGIEEEPALARLRLELQFGAHMLLIVGAAAIVGGIQALRARRRG